MPKDTWLPVSLVARALMGHAYKRHPGETERQHHARVLKIVRTRCDRWKMAQRDSTARGARGELLPFKIQRYPGQVRGLRLVRLSDARRIWRDVPALDSLVTPIPEEIPTTWDGMVDELRRTRLMLRAEQERRAALERDGAGALPVKRIAPRRTTNAGST